MNLKASDQRACLSGMPNFAFLRVTKKGHFFPTNLKIAGCGARPYEMPTFVDEAAIQLQVQPMLAPWKLFLQTISNVKC